MSLFATGPEIVTVEYKINFLAPARGDRMVAKGRVVRAGRTITITACEVRSYGEGGKRLCALLQQTSMQG